MLAIGGRDYAMTCAPGEEDHIAALGHMIDEKLRTLPDNASKNETRSLLFAALLLADELFEHFAPDGTGAARRLPRPRLDEAPSPERLAALADRLEALAEALEIAA